MATEIVYRNCHLCEAHCGVAIEVDNEQGVVLSVRGDKDDPFSRGYICPKAVGLKELHEDPDRIRVPLRRRGDRWEEISGLTFTRITSGGNDWDDGAGWGSTGNNNRGDIRVAMRFVDGPSGIFVFARSPGDGDIVLDHKNTTNQLKND